MKNSDKLLNDSFVDLFFHYAKGLVVYAMDFSLSKEDAEDIVHDVFVNLWQRMDEIETQTVKAYLFRATRNMCLNYISRLKVRSKYLDDILEGKIVPVNDNTDYYIQSELRMLLDEAINRLPPQRRRIFIMNRLEGKSSNEIAEEMKISHRTVDKHIQLSSKEIKEYISKYLFSIIIAGIFS